MTLSANQIRERYLRFFEERGHRLVKSASLVPDNDPTLLFTTAGMAQFKDAFLGLGNRGYTRATSCQKCLRVGDIDRVGRTAFHHTFFEMLGNFSFGDYFKAEAIAWAWELVVQGFQFPESRLQVTVFQEDEEARQIWEKTIGLPRARVHAGGEGDNFWPANARAEGPNGPCGPCSEIYVDRGAEFGCGRPECSPLCSCGRWVEIWNLVFTQYERKEGGVLTPLPRKNIDTGMGMERITAAVQGHSTSYDTDLLAPVVRAVAEASGRPYESKTEAGARMRRIADHARALSFCITDGVLPSNEGRGYVLRRLLRRAARDGRELGLQEPFLQNLIPPVVKAMGKPYPELAEREATIRQVLTAEEERFRHSLEQGSAILEDTIRKLQSKGQAVLPGEDAFRLYDTYGFPLDLIEHALEERKMTVDRAAFEAAMLRQRDQSREGSTMKGDVFSVGPVKELLTKVKETEFLGYAKVSAKAKAVGFILEDSLVSSLEKGLKGTLVLDRSPFYAESGGQVGDTGLLRGPHGVFEVSDTRGQDGLILHHGRMAEGRLAVGEEVSAEVDKKRRASIMRHHTATHLLHAALRKVLGPHVEQAGSLVAPHVLRFDFRHPKAMTAEEIRKVENLVNKRVLSNTRVSKEAKPIAQARAEGAMALFGEKYGDEVRVVTVGTFSKELCGGTHCRRTGDIGAFRITAERAVASGVRRIEAVAGARSVALMREHDRLLGEASAVLKAPPEELPKRVATLAEELKKARKEIERLKREKVEERLSGDLAEKTFGSVETIANIKIVPRGIGDGSMEDLKGQAEILKATMTPCVVILGGFIDKKPALLIAATEEAISKGIDANLLVKTAAPAIEGRGGGKPAFAQAGGSKASGLDEAIRLAQEAARTALQKSSS